MRFSKSAVAISSSLLAVLLISIDAHAAAVIGPKLTIQPQPVSVVAYTQTGSRRQGTVNVNGVNWVCSGTNCSALTPPAVASSPVALCQWLAREIGAMRVFTVANRLLNVNELNQCNSVVPAAATMTQKAPSNVPGSRSYPVNIRTEVLSLTGTGRQMERPPFAPKNIRTEELTVVGTGNQTARLPFTPINIRTEALTVTGTGVVR